MDTYYNFIKRGSDAAYSMSKMILRSIRISAGLGRTQDQQDHTKKVRRLDILLCLQLAGCQGSVLDVYNLCHE